MATTSTMTVEEYLELDRASETRVEFLAGEVHEMVGANRRHLQIVSNLHGHLFQQLKGRGWRVWMNDVRVSPSTNSYVYPDVVVLKKNATLTPLTGVDTLREPVVIVEVFSPSTEQRDRGIKRELYCEIPSLHDYVLVASATQHVEHWSRDPAGAWQCRVLTESNESLDFGTIGASLLVADLYDSVDW